MKHPTMYQRTFTVVSREQYKDDYGVHSFVEFRGEFFEGIDKFELHVPENLFNQFQVGKKFVVTITEAK